MIPKHRYDLIPMVKDPANDFEYTMQLVQLSKRIDLSETQYLRQPADDQGKEGSCGPNAADKVVDFIIRKQGKPFLYPSRQGLYFMTREEMGEKYIYYDSGVDNRSMAKTLVKRGVFPESMWPYDKSLTERPPDDCYKKAEEEQMLLYEFIDPENIPAIKNVLAGLKIPFIAGIVVYESFESDEVARTGRVPMPQNGEQLLGGHDVAVIGYNEIKKLILFYNSWGDKWGMNGVGSLPYAYVQNFGMDFTVVRKME